jgi:hypothetical protein
MPVTRKATKTAAIIGNSAATTERVSAGPEA